MDTYRLGICDQDKCYAVGVMEFINTRKDIPLSASVFTSYDDMVRFIAQDRLDILMLGEEITDACEGEMDIPMVYLTETKTSKPTTGKIFKYQNLTQLCEQVLELAKHHIYALDSEGFYAVYSPIASSIRDDYVSSICGAKDKVLVIKLEEFVGEEKDVSETFMYYLLSHNEEILDLMKPDRNGEIQDVIYGAKSYLEIREIKKEDLDWLRKLLMDNPINRDVLFDIDGGTLGDIEVLLSFDKTYIPYESGAYSVNRIDGLKKLIGYGSGNEYDRRLKFINLTHDEP